MGVTIEGLEIGPSTNVGDVTSWIKSLPCPAENTQRYAAQAETTNLTGRAILETSPTHVLAWLKVNTSDAPTVRQALDRVRTDFIVRAMSDVSVAQQGELLQATRQGFAGERAETQGWVTLREGYLYKSKRSKKSFNAVKSTKLRFFVLKQEPQTFETELEYYEGMIMRGVIPICGAAIIPDSERPGKFRIENQGRTVELATEKSKVNDSLAWIMALQQAVNAAADHPTRDRGSTESVKPPKPPRPETILASEEWRSGSMAVPSGGDDAEVPRRRKLTGDVDGNAIDAARWAAVRKGFEKRYSVALGGIAEEVDPEDEDLIRLRQMEEEEELRQQEERKLFLAMKAAKRLSAISATSNVSAVPESVGYVSEDDEDWERIMREKEEEEEKRQEMERLEWLKEQEAKKQAESK
eukprot:m.18046 g.18046  ORF g.18046 m.18046 type:complete len:411 (+) comp6176_c0_seq1:79-1311(+)